MLDLACGAGRHTRLFLDRACRVTAVDRDLGRIADIAASSAGGGTLERLEADLEGSAPWPLGDRRFDAVVVTNYLWRPLLPSIVASVAPGGILVYETFLVGQETLGRPRNPDFLLRPGELLDAVAGQLLPLAFEQGRLEAPGGAPCYVQRICALRGDRPGALPGKT